MTQDDTTQALRAVLLPGFAVLRIAGPDAVTFLQGQFTNDVRLLADGRTALGACCTNQGRVIALVRMRQTDEAVYLLLPADVAGTLAGHLQKYVLRAKVAIDQSTDLQVGAVLASAPGAPGAGPQFDASALTMSPVPLAGTTEVVTFQYAAGREVVAAPAVAWRAIGGLSVARAGEAPQRAWLAEDIAAGLPAVTAATSGQFIPQMLNVDLLDGVSYTKGCYTGQEIVARTHHLGRVKRRTMRYALPPGPVPPLMSNLLLDGAKAADMLLAVDTGAGVDVLAVTNLDAQGRTLQAEDGRPAEPRAISYPLDQG
jgi:folate-binding protein YgfZ